MNRTLKYGLSFLLLVVVAVVLFWPKPSGNKESSDDRIPPRVSRNSDSSTQENLGNVPPVKDSLSAEKLRKIERAKGESKLERMKELIRSDYNTPLDVWGKVIDQDGNPLAGVKAEIVVDEHEANKSYVVLSDKEGLFELLGKRGARARIKVSLLGYASTSNEEIGSNISDRTIYYAPKSKPMPAYAPPTQDNPQVFVLRKKNPVANLAYTLKNCVSVSKTGVAQKIELKSDGKTVEVEVRCWSSCPVPFTYDKYDWRADIQIAGGKLQSITESEPVTAPVDGYQSVFKVEMPKNTEENWLRNSPNGSRDFWVKFDDGTYAKARIEVKTGRKHEVDAEVWYNLDGTNTFEQ